jgi:hypothetical protein
MELSPIGCHKSAVKREARLAFFLWLSFFRASDTNTPTTCTLRESERFRCSCCEFTSDAMILEYAFSNVLDAFSQTDARRRAQGRRRGGGKFFVEEAHLCRSVSSFHGLNGSSPNTARDIFLFFLSTAFCARADNFAA